MQIVTLTSEQFEELLLADIKNFFKSIIKIIDFNNEDKNNIHSMIENNDFVDVINEKKDKRIIFNNMHSYECSIKKMKAVKSALVVIAGNKGSIANVMIKIKP